MANALAQLGIVMLFAAAAIVAINLFGAALDRLEKYLKSLIDDDER